jgi:hypothetical protein
MRIIKLEGITLNSSREISSKGPIWIDIESIEGYCSRQTGVPRIAYTEIRMKSGKTWEVTNTVHEISKLKTRLGSALYE